MVSVTRPGAYPSGTDCLDGENAYRSGSKKTNAPQICDRALLFINGHGIRIALAEGKIGSGIIFHVMNRRR